MTEREKERERQIGVLQYYTLPDGPPPEAEPAPLRRGPPPRATPPTPTPTPPARHRSLHQPPPRRRDCAAGGGAPPRLWVGGRAGVGASGGPARPTWSGRGGPPPIAAAVAMRGGERRV